MVAEHDDADVWPSAVQLREREDPKRDSSPRSDVPRVEDHGVAMARETRERPVELMVDPELEDRRLALVAVLD
jgi:hypothetical protein